MFTEKTLHTSHTFGGEEEGGASKALTPCIYQTWAPTPRCFSGHTHTHIITLPSVKSVCSQVPPRASS